jgi:hypothetical protein
VNFSFITHTIIYYFIITKLETKNMSLNDSMQIVESVIEKLKIVNGDVVKKKNPGYIDFKTINDIMSGDFLLKIWNYRLLII